MRYFSSQVKRFLALLLVMVFTVGAMPLQAQAAREIQVYFDGSSTSMQLLTVGAAANIPAFPDGQSGGYWYESKGATKCTPDQKYVTITAQMGNPVHFRYVAPTPDPVPQKYTVTLYYNGANLSQSKIISDIEANTTLQTVLERAGVSPTKGDGWYNSLYEQYGKPTALDTATTITGNSTFYYTKYYSVTFEDGNYTSTRYVPHGYKYLSPPTRTKSEEETHGDTGLKTVRYYTLDGWYNNSNKQFSVGNNGITEGGVYTAKWSTLDNLGGTYTVTFEEDENDSSKTIKVSGIRKDAVFKSFPEVSKEGMVKTSQWVEKGTNILWTTTTKVTKDVTLVPKWVTQTYDVKFYKFYSDCTSSTVYHTTKVEHGQTIKDIPKNPETFTQDYSFREKVYTAQFTFEYWSLYGDTNNDNEFDIANSKIQENTKLYAVYSLKWIGETPPNDFQAPDINCNGGGGSGGGSSGGDGDGDGDDGEQEQIVRYKYTVNYNGLDGYRNYTLYLKEGTKLGAYKPTPDPQKPKHTFQYWTTDRNATTTSPEFDFATQITGDITIYPVWGQDITVIFNSDGGDYNSLYTRPYNTTLTTAQQNELQGENAPKRDYYSFLHWDEDRQSSGNSANAIDLGKKRYVQPNETMWAWYQPDTKLVFHYNGKETQGEESCYINEGDSLIIMDHAPSSSQITPDKATQKLIGWSFSPDGTKLISNTDKITNLGGTTDVYGVWVNCFRVKFDTNMEVYKPELGSQPSAVQTITMQYTQTGDESQDKIIPPDIGTIEHGGKKYYVSGWYISHSKASQTDENKADFVEIWNEGVREELEADFTTVYAKWEEIKQTNAPKAYVYFVQDIAAYEANPEQAEKDGLVTEVIGTIGTKLDLSEIPEPIQKNGLYFGGWFYDKEFTKSADVTDLTPSSRLTHVYARFMVQVNFSANAMSRGAIDSVYLKENRTVPRPASPVDDQNKHEFMGWIENGETAESKDDLWNFWEDTVTKNTSLSGVWGNAVTFDPMGGTFNGRTPRQVVFAQADDEARKISKPEEPIRDGYEFVGWTADDGSQSSAPMMTYAIAPLNDTGDDKDAKDEVTVNLFDFDKPIDQNTVLYAVWKASATPTPTPPPTPTPTPTTYQLTVNVSGNGSISGGGLSASGSNSYKGTYTAGTQVTFNANPDSNAYLYNVYSSTGSISKNGNRITFTMPSQVATIEVNFRTTNNNNSGSSGGSSSSSSDKDTAWKGGGTTSSNFTNSSKSSSKNNSTSGNKNSASSSTSYNSEYYDISGHWARSAIEYVSSHGLFQGMAPGEFRPDEKMTRGMFITVLSRLSGESTSAGSSRRTVSYNDVPEDEWYAEPIAWATRNYLATGINGGFEPNRPITREEMAIIFNNFMEYSNKKPTSTNPTTIFADESKISSYAARAIHNMQQYGLLSGMPDGTFQPQGTASRAEVATLFQRFANAV